MVIARVRTVLSGLPVGGGLSTHYFTSPLDLFDSQDLVDAVGLFWDTAKTVMSPGTTMTVQGQVDLLNEVNGELVGSGTANQVTKTGTAAGNAMPPSLQALIRLGTADIADGRRVRGRLFIPSLNVPGQDTQIVPANTRVTLVTAATSLLTASGGEYDYCVWRRPREATAQKPYRPGSAHEVTGVSVWEKYAVLRSRRD